MFIDNIHNCIIKGLKRILNELEKIYSNITDILNELCGISQNSSEDSYRLYATQAGENPMTVAGEYPEEIDGRYVYTTIKVRFLDMLNPNMLAIFKRNPDTFNQHLPIYFKDTSNYEHTVTIGDINTPAYGDEITRNFNYPALYVGNYIVLNPTQQTLDDFENGLIQN